MDSGEGKIVASSKSTYKATSTTETEFTFVEGEPLSMTYTPRNLEYPILQTLEQTLF